MAICLFILSTSKISRNWFELAPLIFRRDKSKGDIVSKGLATIQTGWFTMQCIACRAARLAITELEIMTVAAFALVTYIFWWNKPLNVTCPIRILLKESHHAPD
jgi:hypothetical protein